jgi:hypothetical protein
VREIIVAPDPPASDEDSFDLSSDVHEENASKLDDSRMIPKTLHPRTGIKILLLLLDKQLEPSL